jgi:hypothetical protein
LQAVAHDPDGDALEYSSSIEVTWEEIRSGYHPAGGMETETGRFWFRPSSADTPSRRITFMVDDGRGGRDSTAFRVVVE